MNESTFLAAILAAPHDWAPRLVFADWLEERGDPRGELIVLLHELARPLCKYRHRKEARLRALLGQDVVPIAPIVTNSIGMEFILVPLVPWIGQRAYLWVARHRYRLVPCHHGVCHVPQK